MRARYVAVGLLFLSLLACEEKIKPERKSVYDLNTIPFVSDWEVDSSHLGTIVFPKGEKWVVETDNYYLDTLELNLSRKYLTEDDFRKKEELLVNKIKQSYKRDSAIYKKVVFDSIEKKEDHFGVKTIVLIGENKHYRIKDLIFISDQGAEAVFSIVNKKNVPYQDTLLMKIEKAYRLNVK